MTLGLPASGKSTWAKEQVKQNPRKVKRVNKDDLRAMLHAGEWSRKLEDDIIAARDELIGCFLADGKDVIVDDTNFGPHKEKLKALADLYDARFEVQDFTDVPLQTCIDRDSARGDKSVGAAVIKKMWRQYVKLNRIEEYVRPEYNKDLPFCIIVDIDGTLAHMAGRSPYDYSLVATDDVDVSVSEIVRRYAGRDIIDEIPNTYVLIVSGRDATCKPETEAWLQANNIPYDEIYMRDPERLDEHGNKIDDSIIKQEIYETWIKPRYNVRFVLDDRDRVVKMWREQGLKVLQVAYGDF